jgi:hypothetical protein
LLVIRGLPVLFSASERTTPPHFAMIPCRIAWKNAMKAVIFYLQLLRYFLFLCFSFAMKVEKEESELLSRECQVVMMSFFYGTYRLYVAGHSFIRAVQSACSSESTAPWRVCRYLPSFSLMQRMARPFNPHCSDTAFKLSENGSKSPSRYA